MKQRIGSCPACGAPVEFKLSTALVTICESCHSVVARGDKRLEDHGRVADLVETDSPVQVGMTGLFEKKSFQVVGRVQYQHPAGGVWDEYYLKFPGDKVRWLAAAQGKLYLTTERRLSQQTPLPEFDSLDVGDRIQLADGKYLVIAETGTATARSAEGEIPWVFRPDAEHRFADLNGENQEFATIEESGTESGPRMFLGREVTVDELKLTGIAQTTTVPPAPNTQALQINCPQCAGPLNLHAPDETKRVCCPNCHSLLDCNRGRLEYLQTLKFKVTPQIPLGTTGTLDGVKYTVIGFMCRYVIEERIEYSWTEYLLYNPQSGFRWLICNKKHWSIAESITCGATPESNQVTFQGTRCRLYDRGIAYVKYVVGEFYWRVNTGDRVHSEDYIAPPFMLSFEKSTSAAGNELVVSQSKYLDVDTLEAAFGLKDLPRPWGIGTIQPALPLPTGFWWILASTFGILMLLYMVYSSGADPTKSGDFAGHLIIAVLMLIAWPIVVLVKRSEVEVKRWNDSDYSPYQQAE
ncbi:MAG: DUF4178 domain-containing protein [Planctomycetota bacterium]